jgi:3-oxoacyl-[acyl-carrier protein] reductase
MNRLDGRVALVTGSSRGIGAAIASRFAEEGARVAVHGRDDAALEGVRRRIEAAGGQVVAVTADVTRSDELDRVRQQVEQAFGPVDVLVANAGGNPVRPGPLEEIDEVGWRDSLDVNLTSTFLTLKAFLPAMKQRGRGSIVTMSSAAARRPTDRSPIGYAAAKAGIEVLTKAAAIQAGPYGVRVNCIAPESILTERNRAQIPPDVQAQLAQTHPIRRLGTPEDVADAAVFLASDESAWVSGIVVDVAGGSVLV